MEDGCVNKEELIEVLRQFEEKRVEELPEKTRNIFYAIMKIADERDELENIRKETIEYINRKKYQPSPLGFELELNPKELYQLQNILNKGDKNE